MRLNLNCVTGNNDHLYKRIHESIHTSTSIDIIVSFLMESGVKLLHKDLETIKDKNIPIRILTGNYLNITQPSALYLLKDILGDNVDLRFYNDTKKSFHAKAYIFEKDEEGEIFIGSSNLSKSALTSGIEWNYRIDKKSSEADYKYFKSIFEELFLNESIIVNDEELQKYSNNWKRPKVFSRIEEKKEKINSYYDEGNNITSLFEPKGAQIEALYELKKTRNEGNDKALVVAATGIGKTYLAAFDSRQFDRVLFIAHREEILKQAYETFKSVRIDKFNNNSDVLNKFIEDVIISKTNYNEDGYNMGFFMNSIKDIDKDIVFASVQSLGKENYLNEQYFARDYFDYIVVDEFHHAVSKNYQNIINYFTPKFMLGLTATPDRLDNKDVFSICDYNTVYEATLKTSINKGWLVPFRYYGIYDESVNYEEVEFKNGKYNEKQLEKALKINKRANLILRHYKKYKSSSALGFCTSKSHADFMAKYFNEQGISACAVYSGSEGEYNEDRNIALSKLRKEEIKVIFSVDMFNEGLDVKSIDMVMFLRPTESPTVFLQQLGRGLRKDKNKKYLNVLDFIGNYKKANLVPYLLTGENKKRKVYTGVIPHEEDYPEDCFIDFDFRLVDIFERMEKDNKKLEELIADEYFKIKEELGHSPSRVEMFTYMDDELYENMKKKPKFNIFKDYLKFLQEQQEIDKNEDIIDSLGHEFIKCIENTRMEKSYKMPLLLAFYNNGHIKSVIDNNDIYESFEAFFNKGSNKVDVLKEYPNFHNWVKKDYIDRSKQPINALSKTHSEFFIKKDGAIFLNKDLEKYYSNDLFIKHFKDVIEFRTKEYYKNRFDKK